jgi:hypothetical protein
MPRCARHDEAGAAAKHANGVAEIGAEFVEETEPERGVDVLFVGFDAAELDTGATERFGGGETGALEVFGDGVRCECGVRG